MAEWSREAVSPSGLGRRRDLGRRHGNKLGELSEVLDGGCEQELGPRTIWAAESKASHSEDALQVGEEHLNPLTLAP